MNKYEMDTVIKITLVPAGSLLIAFVITYGFALLGEPQSLWIMKLIGVM